MKIIVVIICISLLLLVGCASKPGVGSEEEPMILRDAKPGVYIWTHSENGQKYIVIIREFDVHDPVLIRWYIDQKMRSPSIMKW